MKKLNNLNIKKIRKEFEKHYRLKNKKYKEEDFFNYLKLFFSTIDYKEIQRYCDIEHINYKCWEAGSFNESWETTKKIHGV